MSIETFIARAVANEQIKDKVERDTILALCAFADSIQIYFKKETLKEVLEQIKKDEMNVEDWLTRTNAAVDDLQNAVKRLKKLKNGG
jgi:predicted nuclease with TOPRIM domain